MSSKRYAISLGVALAAVFVPAASYAVRPATADGPMNKTVTVNVAVFEQSGEPVSGLTEDQLTVVEDGRPVEIRRLLELGGGAHAASVPVHTVIVFDNRRLQKRHRSAVIESLGAFLETQTSRGHALMVAVLGERREVVQPFTDDLATIAAALDAVGEMPTRGQRSASRALTLRRDLAEAGSLSRNAFPGNTAAGFAGDDVFGSLQAQRLKADLDEYRRTEFNEVRGSVLQLAGLLESLSGVPGPKHVLVVSEKLTMWPGLDLYRTLFRQLGREAESINLLRPDEWRRQMELRAQFGMLANVAQASGVAVHVIDTYDHDRDRTDFNYSGQDMDRFFGSYTDSMGTIAEEDLEGAQDIAAGSRYVAGATGGSMLAAGRGYDAFLQRFQRRVSSGYWVEYDRREGETLLHELDVRVPGEDRFVAHPRQVIAVDPDRRLANEVIARLKLDTGRDPLGIEASLGPAEPYEGETTVRTVRVTVPADTLTLEVDGGTARGRIGVIVSVMEDDGDIVEPRIIEFPIEISSDRIGRGVRALAKVRLLFSPASERLAVAVRDEASGIASTTAFAIGGG